MRVMILGIGNILMSDEGIGVRVVEEFGRRHQLPDGVEIIDGGTSGMDMLDSLAGLDHLFVVDAVRSGDPPGTLIRLEDEEVPALFQTRLSPHQLGLSDVLASLKLMDEYPGHIVLLGCEPESLAVGMGLTPVVEAQIGPLVAGVRAELAAIGVGLE